MRAVTTVTARLLRHRREQARTRRLIAASVSRYDEFSGLTEAAVWRSIEEARACGHGITREQVAPGYIGVGLAMRNDRGEPEAAVTVVGSVRRMTPEHVETCLAIVRKHLEQLGPIDLAARPT